ncbi:hypothetical protein JYU34_003296 [Plutella xylostella]|uniref:Uncharacterized protein n=1 Tax=Plutella xylostella TaxID=51655 RepID=A0ABQ7QZN8_PLUXY|nr:hypothetical protein JYU34_003296 [Plutella xylostella]
MVMERLADFVSKSLEGGEAPAPPPEDSDEDAEAELEVDITALDDKPPPPKRPRNWLLSPAPPHCKREDDDDDSKHGECTDTRIRQQVIDRGPVYSPNKNLSH